MVANNSRIQEIIIQLKYLKCCMSELNLIRFSALFFFGKKIWWIWSKDTYHGNFDRMLFLVIIFYLLKLHIVRGITSAVLLLSSTQLKCGFVRWNWKLIICNMKPNFPNCVRIEIINSVCGCRNILYPLFYFDDDDDDIGSDDGIIFNEISNLPIQYNILCLPHWPHTETQKKKNAKHTIKCILHTYQFQMKIIALKIIYNSYE